MCGKNSVSIIVATKLRKPSPDAMPSCHEPISIKFPDGSEKAISATFQPSINGLESLDSHKVMEVKEAANSNPQFEFKSGVP